MRINKLIIFALLFLITLQIPAQGFDISKFSDPKKYGWSDYTERSEYRQRLKSKEELLQLYEVKQRSITENMAKSAVFPGWGHYSISSYTKGHVFLSTELILAGAGFYFISRSNDYYDKYKNASQINTMNSNYDKAEENYNTSIIFFAAYALVWAYCLYDTSESTEEYNANLWRNLERNHLQNISISPNGIEVRF